MTPLSILVVVIVVGALTAQLVVTAVVARSRIVVPSRGPRLRDDPNAVRVAWYQTAWGRAAFGRHEIGVSALSATHRSRDLVVRRTSVDGVVVDRWPFRTRIRLVVGGRPLWIMSIWVSGPTDGWRAHLQALGWLDATEAG